MRVIIRTIPHKDQPYNTVGMWRYNLKEKTLLIEVSECSDPWREFLIAIHEYVEAMLCLHAGITAQEVTDFDLWWEKEDNKTSPNEPGDDPASPYRREHCSATGIERMIASYLNIDWFKYERELWKLGEDYGNGPQTLDRSK